MNDEKLISYAYELSQAFSLIKDKVYIPPPLPLPKINYYEELQSKDPKKCHRRFQKLLNDACIQSNKTIPKTPMRRATTTIEERLTELYLKSQRKNNLVKDLNFLRDDFLKELVMKEDLKCIVLEILPEDKCFFRIENVRVPTKIEGIIYEDIDNGTLSVATYEVLFKLLTLYSCEIKDYMHNYNFILNIRKYITNDVNESPIFSTFLVLKCSNMLFTRLAKPSKKREDKPFSGPDLETLEKESRMIAESSGALYLGTNPLAKEFNNYLRDYQYKFNPELIKLSEKEDDDLDPLLEIPAMYSILKESALKLGAERAVKKPLKLNPEDIIKPEKSWIESLKEFLAKRKFKKPKDRYVNFYKVAEMYTVKYCVYNRKYKRTTPHQCYITVFNHFDGTFRYCVTERIFLIRQKKYPRAVFIDKKNKKEVDMYICTVLSILHQKSLYGLDVFVNNLSTHFQGHFYTANKDEIKEMNKGYKELECPHQDIFSEASRKYLVGCGYNDDESYAYNYYRQPVLLTDGTITEGLVRGPKIQYYLDADLRLQRQKYDGRRDEDLVIIAGRYVEDGNKRTAFEVHRCEQAKTYIYKTHGEDGKKITYEYYSSLIHPCCSKREDWGAIRISEYTREDYLEMTKFLELCVYECNFVKRNRMGRFRVTLL